MLFHRTEAAESIDSDFISDLAGAVESSQAAEYSPSQRRPLPSIRSGLDGEVKNICQSFGRPSSTSATQISARECPEDRNHSACCT
jgi:hypothetical protein